MIYTEEDSKTVLEVIYTLEDTKFTRKKRETTIILPRILVINSSK